MTKDLSRSELATARASLADISAALAEASASLFSAARRELLSPTKGHGSFIAEHGKLEALKALERIARLEVIEIEREIEEAEQREANAARRAEDEKRWALHQRLDIRPVFNELMRKTPLAVSRRDEFLASPVYANGGYDAPQWVEDLETVIPEAIWRYGVGDEPAVCLVDRKRLENWITENQIGLQIPRRFLADQRHASLRAEAERNATVNTGRSPADNRAQRIA